MSVGEAGKDRQAAGPKEGAAGATSCLGAPACVAGQLQQLLPLLPKRKRSPKPDGMPRVPTMDALTIECDCRSSPRPAPPAVAGPMRAGEAQPPPLHRNCSYYAASAAGAVRPGVYSFTDAPAVLRFNKYVRSGYRAGYTYRQCCASVLRWHNETGNIWTHMLPALLLLALLAGGQLQAWQGARVAFLLNVGSIAACFLGSVAFHTFMAHHHHYHQWLCLDVCGVLLVLVGGGHMVLWWGLFCLPTARWTLTLLYYGVGALCVRAALTASTALGRGLPMLSLLLVRLSAFVARGLLEPPSQALLHYAAMEAFSLTGGLINVLRIPERWLQPVEPGKAAPLDHLLNSHQLMHVLVAAAMWQLHLGATADYHSVTALLSGAAQCPG
ncbi:hypothetical protein ABPG77_005252 [Micractinium sp. CCAP 211/92]